MALIKVFRNGTKISECTLDPMKEYILGRGNRCDVVLDHLEVSRQHAKLVFNGQSWDVSGLSKFGRLSVNGHTVETINLAHGNNFSIAPFEIRFLEAEGRTTISISTFNSDK